ncbi:MAG: tyrosine-type recombinase/integrase [Prevotella sp.]|nr:tyrosine-type recombinase/integrase [Prevotella sp.]
MIRFIEGLTPEERKKYANAIRRGYFDDFDQCPRAWKHTFAGAFIWKNPMRVAYVEHFRNLIGHIPTWDDITDLNLEDYAEVILRHYSNNSARTNFAEIKAIINRHKYEVDIPSKQFQQILTMRAEPSQAIYLTEDEIEKVDRYIPLNDTEKYVKRIFLIEAYTGARNCDSIRLSIDNCDMQTNMLTYVSQKTKTQISVPLHKNLIPYLNDASHKRITLSTFNSTLRRICRHCHIETRTELFRRGRYESGPKWQFVSSHTGRRSFATNLFMHSAHPSTIARMMGHSSPEITMRQYIIGYFEADKNVMKFFNNDLK